ncbi:ABC transporter permease, partial [Clostridioides difficile]|nr:ABC transporter permease [Clostridioides difficile]
NDNLFVARTFASKALTMSFTFGTLSMLILLSLLCLNFSSINKGAYRTITEETAPYDVDVFDWKQPFDDLNEYIQVVDEDYTINETIEYNIYAEPNEVQFYDTDPVMKLSDYNKLLKLRNMDTLELENDEYFIVTSRQLLYRVENNESLKNIQISNKKLHLKGTDTKSYWAT